MPYAINSMTLIFNEKIQQKFDGDIVSLITFNKMAIPNLEIALSLFN